MHEQVPTAHHPQNEPGGSDPTLFREDQGQEEPGAQDLSCLGDEAPGPVAFDIETTGLEADAEVTCVCVAGRDRSWAWTASRTKNRDEIVAVLDSASLIMAYNGAWFDIPVLQRWLGLGHEVVGRWMAKLVDPHYAARALLGTRACARLAVILELNGLAAKTGSGAEAAQLARDGEWERLEAYCMQDARVTLALGEEMRWVEGLSCALRSRGVFAWA